MSQEDHKNNPVDQRQYYNQWWKGIDGWSFVRWVPEEREICMRRLIQPGQKVLDVGCGDGSAYAESLVKSGIEVFGVDISDVAVEEANSRGIKAVRASLDEPLPFPDGEFDVVLCIDMILHLLDPEFAVQEMFRVLRPGGKLLICVNNVGNWRNRIDHLFFGYVSPMGTPITSRRYPWRDPGVRLFTNESVGNLLSDVGFLVEEQGGWETKFWNRAPGLRDLMDKPFALPLHAPLQDFASRYPNLLAGTCMAVGRKPATEQEKLDVEAAESVTSSLDGRKTLLAAAAVLTTMAFLR
ncbi:MAG TPA: methyltransferase domain-containing protein, partial [Abditibacterium sp.]